MSWNPEDNLSDSDDEEETVGVKGREGFIFVVDALLFQKYDEFEECLSIIRDALLNGLLTRANDLIGIVINNTEHSPPPKDPTGMENIVPHKNTAVFLPLRPLSKEAVDYFLNFQVPDHFNFQNKYGCKEGNFANMIWLCTNMFQQCGYKLSLPSIVYFTNIESPHSVDTSEYQQALRKANDLSEIPMDFMVVPMGDNFNYNTFYKEFFCTVTDTDLDSFIPEEPARTRSVIANRMVRKNYQTHCTSYVRWIIGNDLNIAVGIYNFYKRKYYPETVRLFREDNSFIESKRTYKIFSQSDPSTEERVSLPNEQRKQITIGGEKIYFTNEELHHIKCPMTPGLQLLGFKPRGMLNHQNFLKSADFLFPDEKHLAGSTKLFRALWEKCLEKDKIAMCTLVTKRNTSPQYVALIPVKSQNNEQLCSSIYSDGFHIWYLPCQSDIRRSTLPDRPPCEDTQAEVDLVAKVLKKLKIRYLPEIFKDPALNALRTSIIYETFDIETQDPIDLNSLECMGIDEERLNQVIYNFKEHLENIQGDPEVETALQKRKNTLPPTQKSKIPKTTSSLSREDVERFIANDTLDKLTVKDLKEYLKANNVSGISSATKPTLIEQVLTLHRN